MTEDEKQIAEAKKDIEKKGPDSQTEKDRIDESVGEQEKLDGNKDSQTAKDRVDESEGAKKADEKRAEEKKDDRPSWAAEMSEAMNKLVSMFEKFTADMSDHHDAEEKHMAEEEKLGESSKKYATGLAAGYAGGGEKKYSISDVEKLLKSTR